MRRAPRNVHVWDTGTQPATELAGFNQHGSVSIALFHSWLTALLVVNASWALFPANDKGHSTGPALDGNDSNLLEPGNYTILSPEGKPLQISLTAESYRPRTLSLDVTGTPRTNTFRDRVRARDERCCVTGDKVPYGYYTRFRACHIFPIAHRDIWDLLRLSRFIQDDAREQDQGPCSINSVQNGLLLRSDIHDMFDNYLIGINPDDDYRVVDFLKPGEFDGCRLWINEQVDSRYRPSDDLLREHFRQCVLANVKEAGRTPDDMLDPEDEFDLSNFARWGQSLAEGQPSRLELELRSRLYNGAVHV